MALLNLVHPGHCAFRRPLPSSPGRRTRRVGMLNVSPSLTNIYSPNNSSIHKCSATRGNGKLTRRCCGPRVTLNTPQLRGVNEPGCALLREPQYTQHLAKQIRRSGRGAAGHEQQNCSEPRISSPATVWSKFHASISADSVGFRPASATLGRDRQNLWAKIGHQRTKWVELARPPGRTRIRSRVPPTPAHLPPPLILSSPRWAAWRVGSVEITRRQIRMAARGGEGEHTCVAAELSHPFAHPFCPKIWLLCRSHTALPKRRHGCRHVENACRCISIRCSLCDPKARQYAPS